MKRVLIIKYGALGDMFQAFGAFAALRHYFPHTHITLLTRPAYAALMRHAPWFDEIICDDRPPLSHPKSWPDFLKLYRAFQSFDAVFDLQNAQRTRLYFHLLRLSARLNIGHLPLWSGQVRGASWRHNNPQARMMHTLSRQDDQLRQAGIMPIARTRADWLAPFGPVITKPYVVLVPGSAAHRPRKSWPAERFAALVPPLDAAGFRIVLVGDSHQASLAQHILKRLYASTPLALKQPVLDLTGQTSLTELAGLIGRAHFVLGNDTGPLHIAAEMGVDFVALFSDESDPRRTAPTALSQSENGKICKGYLLHAHDLAQISSKMVLDNLREWGLLYEL